jgi:hypothetical protein
MGGALTVFALFDLAGIGAFGIAFFPADRIETDFRADWRAPLFEQSKSGAPRPENAVPQTLTRPIFSKTRRPFIAKGNPPELREAQEPLVPPPGLMLLGVVKHKAGQSAFIVSSSTPKGKWCGIGDGVDGWKVTLVQDLEITLQSGARTVQLSLYPAPQYYPNPEPHHDPNPGAQMQPHPQGWSGKYGPRG